MIRVAFVLLALAATTHAQTSATYQVTLSSTWSAQTHPTDFPPDPHYSPLVGATHTPGAALLSPGTLASPGIESMAETGATALLRAEAAALQAQGLVGSVLLGGGIALSPGEVQLTLTTDAAFPLVTLVTMLAPSPDWFVGTHGVSLRDAAGWLPSLAVPLFVYDAGTDSGTSYTSPNLDTQPREPVAALTMAPFLVNGAVPAVGTMTFTLLGVTYAAESPSAGVALSAPAPNPASGDATVTLTLDAPSRVRLDLVDTRGRTVATIWDAETPAGDHRIAVPTRGLASGVYTIRALGLRESVSRRLVVR